MIASLSSFTDWWNLSTGADLPKVREENGIATVVYEKITENGIDYSHPKEEGSNIARFVYRIAKFNPRVKVLNLKIRYTVKNADQKEGEGDLQALIDDMDWVHELQTESQFVDSYGKYFANVLFRVAVELCNKNLPGTLALLASGELDGVAPLTREQITRNAINLVPDLIQETGLDPSLQPPLNRTAFTSKWRAMNQTGGQSDGSLAALAGPTPWSHGPGAAQNRDEQTFVPKSAPPIVNTIPESIATPAPEEADGPRPVEQPTLSMKPASAPSVEETPSEPEVRRENRDEQTFVPKSAPPIVNTIPESIATPTPEEADGPRPVEQPTLNMKPASAPSVEEAPSEPEVRRAMPPDRSAMPDQKLALQIAAEEKELAKVYARALNKRTGQNRENLRQNAIQWKARENSMPASEQIQAIKDRIKHSLSCEGGRPMPHCLREITDEDLPTHFYMSHLFIEID